MKYLIILCILLIVFGCNQSKYAPDYVNWSTYHGDETASHYSALSIINKENLDQLELAWIYQSKDADNRSQIQCNPIIIDGRLYATTPQLKIFALDAATGKEIWLTDPFDGETVSGVNRGVMYWTDGREKRIIYPAGNFLISVDALTGHLIPSFGKEGKLDLRESLDGSNPNLDVVATSPGVIYDNLIIMGSRVSEGQEAAPGHIRAFDVHTGKVRWTFHTIPRPGDYGYETWPSDSWQKVGGANSWAGVSLDKERGIVYVPTGSPSFDFHGGNRHGDNLFGNSLIALDASSGERIWHFQSIHHDLWDRDLPCQPNLITLERNGKTIDAVAQVTKHGLTYVFDRVTGEPLFPIEETPVPSSDLINEKSAPTQPDQMLPEPFMRQAFTLKEVSNLLPESQESILKQLEGVRLGHKFMPPSTEGTVIFPGFDGGADWGGAAVDPQQGMLYINATEMPWIHQMIPLSPKGEVLTPGRQLYLANCGACHAADLTGQQHLYPSLVQIGQRLSTSAIKSMIKNGKGRMPGFKQLTDEEVKTLIDYLTQKEEPVNHMNWAVAVPKDSSALEIPYSFTGYKKLKDAYGLPAIQPPWGTLNAIDLSSGKIKWKVPLGAIDSLTEKGIPITGLESYGGPVVTASGLIIIGGTPDNRLRIFDQENGQLLWEYTLPAAGYATPATYQVKNQQYIVIAAGGGKLGSPSADFYLAFALKNK